MNDVVGGVFVTLMKQLETPPAFIKPFTPSTTLK